MKWFNNALILFAVCAFMQAKAQNADSLLNAFVARMSEIKSGELEYIVKWRPFLKTDTTKNNVRLRFVNPADADSFLFLAVDERTIYLYDFDKFYRAFVKTNKLYVRETDWKNIYMQTYFVNYTPITNRGKDLQEKKLQGRVTATDTIFSNGKSYKHLHLYIPFEGIDSATKNIHHSYFLHPETLIPEKYIFTLEGLGSNQYVELNLVNYKLNQLKEKTFRKELNKEKNKLAATYTVVENQTAAEFNKNTLDSGASAPAFSLASFLGDSSIFPAKNTKVYLLDFWYISCYPCQLAIPHLQKLYMQYAKNGLEVIGIDINEGDTTYLPDLIKRRKITYPIALNGKPVAEKYGVKAYPTLFLVNADGKIIYRSVGFSEAEFGKMEELIKSELEK